jgi:stage V sporulation protein B
MSGMLIVFILRIILARVFLASGLGIYSMTVLILTLAMLVGALGIPAATVKYAAQYKEREEFNPFVSCSIINSLFFGIIVSLFLFLFSPILSNIFHMPELNNLIKLISFTIPFSLGNRTLLGFLNGLRKMKLYAFGTVFSKILLFSLTGIFIVIGWGIAGAVLAWVLSEIITFIIMLLVAIKYFHFTTQHYVKTTKTILPFGSKLFLAESTHMLDSNIDTLMIGYFMTATDVGIYAIPIALTTGLLLIPGAMSTVSYPIITECYNKKDHKALEEIIQKSLKYSFLITSIISMVFILFGEDIISLLLPRDFLPAYIPLVVLAFSLIFYSSLASVGYALTAVDRPDISYKINGIAIFINFCLNIVLIPVFGILGAAIATSTTFILRPAISFFLTEKIFNIKLNGKWFLIAIGAVAFMITIFFTLRVWLNPYILKSILLLVFAYLTIFLLLKGDDRREIISMIKTILVR